MPSNLFQKKLILIEEEQSQLFEYSLKTVSQKAKSLGISGSALEGYHRGNFPGPSQLKKIANALNVLLAKRAKDPSTSLHHEEVFPRDFENDVDIYLFGRKLGYGRVDCQRIIDEQFYINDGAFDDYTISNETDAKRVYSSTKGVWKGYRRSSYYVDQLIEFRVIIRYITCVNNKYLVRIKCHTKNCAEGISNADNADIKEHYGFVSMVGNNFCWYLFSKGEKEKNHIYMITARPANVRKNGLLFGAYSSFNQSSPPIPMSTGLILQRIDSDPSDESRVELMSKGFGYRDSDDPSVNPNIRDALTEIGTLNLYSAFRRFSDLGNDDETKEKE
jgi:transcriptional regulator with XRE-family HTH domain